MLVIEDNPDMNRFIADVLGRDFRVASAGNGREGLARARELDPDLIVCDVMMPEMTGDEFVLALRGDERMDAIPIVVLSAKADEELRLRLLREGASDYLTKPFSVEELRTRAHSWTDAKLAADARRRLQLQLQGETVRLQWLAEKAEREAREALEETASATALAEHLQELNEMREQFVSTVSHELRTPLTSIRGYVETLLAGEAGELNEEQREYARIVHRNAQRLNALIDDLLMLARMEAGKLKLTRERVDLSDSIRELERSFATTAAASGVVLSVEAGRGLEVGGDRGRLEQAISNLISNAVKFTPSGAQVSVRGCSEDGEVVVEIADEGVGIPEPELERIGERFFRASTAGATLGTGLGLAITRELIELHGGRLEAESVLGEGSTFRLRLPALEAG